jgi:hypothetical protein
MTPEMSPSQLTFGRRTRVIEEGLRENRLWGRDGHRLNEDEREQLYDQCWPPTTLEGVRSARAAEMITRRRERITLDSLQDLIRHMGAIREGRTAVIAVTNGWVLFRPNEELTLLRVDPGTGKRVDPVPGTPAPVGGRRKRHARGGTSDQRRSQRSDRVRQGPDGPGDGRQRAALRESVRRGESRQRQLLPDRSARTDRVRSGTSAATRCWRADQPGSRGGDRAGDAADAPSHSSFWR